MIIAINFANDPYRNVQQINSVSARERGNVDNVIKYSPKDIDPEFKEKHRAILEENRGAGLWLWKPYFCLRTLEDLQEGDYLIYSDSASVYLNDVKYLIKALDKRGDDILCFDLGPGHMERKYTQPKCFEIMGCDSSKYKDTNQRLATFIVIKKSDKSLNFVKEWLSLCCNANLLKTDTEIEIKKIEPAFIKHLEDQSIFSLLTKKYDFKPGRNPSQWGNGRGIVKVFRNTVLDHRNREYPTMFFLHRQKKYNIKTIFIISFQNLFPRVFESINVLRKI